ncbi:MAG: GTPase HflX [Myxococcales bacterium]|nr:GTPase HflX [Myxococcales bacterium]
MADIYGNTSGLAPSELKALERIYRRRVPLDVLTTPELTRSLCEITHATGRQVGVLVDRTGEVFRVIVGDAHQLMLPDVGRFRAGVGRLRGLRLIHTHIGNQPLTRDDLVDLTKLRLDLVAAICVDPAEPKPTWVYYGHCAPTQEGRSEPPYRTYGPLSAHSEIGDIDVGRLVAALEEELARAAAARVVTAKDGRAILVHVCDKRNAADAEDSLRELQELARTAGVAVADTVLQIREKVDPKYVLGRGKLEDVVIRAMQLDAEVLVFDRNLTPAQGAAIAKMTELKVIDRSQLILDIFAQRAQSRDGKLQVELAQMNYLLPRLGSKDDGLSRLTGGIGGRGPGETVLEIGRRRARERITRLSGELRKLERQRKQRRRRRGRNDVAVVAIVGYTNAGKSTLLNTLTGADVLAEDKLFATLDTRTRRMVTPGGREVLLSDTVGFIRHLPKDLFAAFRATFEEAEDADVILHVVDASDPSNADHFTTTERLLAELELDRIPRLVVYNKADQLDPRRAAMLAHEHDGVAVSAQDRRTLTPLLRRLESMLEERDRRFDSSVELRAVEDESPAWMADLGGREL